MNERLYNPKGFRDIVLVDTLMNDIEEQKAEYNQMEFKTSDLFMTSSLPYWDEDSELEYFNTRLKHLSNLSREERIPHAARYSRIQKTKKADFYADKPMHVFIIYCIVAEQLFYIKNPDWSGASVDDKSDVLKNIIVKISVGNTYISNKFVTSEMFENIASFIIDLIEMLKDAVLDELASIKMGKENINGVYTLFYAISEMCFHHLSPLIIASPDGVIGKSYNDLMELVYKDIHGVDCQ